MHRSRHHGFAPEPVRRVRHHPRRFGHRHQPLVLVHHVERGGIGLEWDVADLVSDEFGHRGQIDAKGFGDGDGGHPGCRLFVPVPVPVPVPVVVAPAEASGEHGPPERRLRVPQRRAPADDFAVTRRPSHRVDEIRAAQREVPGPRAPGRELLRAHGAPRVAELEGHRGVRHRVARAPLVDGVGPGIVGAPNGRRRAPMTTRVAASPRAAGRPAAVAGGALAARRWSRPVGPRDAAPGAASTPSARSGGTTTAAAASAAPRRAVPATAPRPAARRRGEDEPAHHRTRRHRVKSGGASKTPRATRGDAE